MADLKEDKIDFVKLERELEEAVKADAKYWRENDAKFRAVEQRVESYEHFRDIVAAAHLRPLEKKDRISESKLQQPWNSVASPANQSTALTQSHDVGQRITEKELPTNSLEFSRDWKHCQDRYNFLKLIGGQRLSMILKCDIGMETLGDVVIALNKSFTQEDAEEVIDILKSLPSCGRFQLALDFLGKKEKGELKQLFEKLEKASRKNNLEGNVGGDIYKTKIEELLKQYELVKSTSERNT